MAWKNMSNVKRQELRRSRALSSYFSLDPRENFEFVQNNQLDDTVNVLQADHTPGAVWAKANVHYEKWTRTTPRPDSLKMQGKLLRRMLHDDAAAFDSHANAAALRAQSSAWHRNSQGLAIGAERAREMVRLNHETAMQNPNMWERRHDMLQMLTVYALEHTGLPGITARPSFARQQGNDFEVDDRTYTWDVTAFSDGSISDVPAGEYRLHIPKETRKYDRLHDDISVVQATRIFGVDSRYPEQLGYVADGLIAAEGGTRANHLIDFVHTNLHGLLARTMAVEPTANPNWYETFNPRVPSPVTN